MNSVTGIEVNAAEDLRYAAQITGDIAALERMFGEDLVYTHSSGMIDGKASFIESIKSGKVRYRKMERHDSQVRVFGTLAVLTGRAVFEVSVNGIDSSVRLRFHSIWEKRANGLQFVSWQATLSTS
jgi:hypothetical protein